MEEIPISALFGALVVLLILSAFFSISETSMMALNRYRLKHQVKLGNRSARLTSLLLAKTDKLLGVILLGNTLINAAATTLSTIIAVLLFGQSELVLGLSTVCITFMLLVFSEITPKIVGASYPERIALPASYILTPLLKLSYPAVWIVNLFARALLWLLRIKPTTETHKLSLEELRTLVLEASHFIPQQHQSILVNLFELENITVNDVMTPRSQIEAIDIDAPPDVIKRQLATCYHTRLPVYQGQMDNITGILHVRRVLNLSLEQQLNSESLREMLRDAYFIPADTPLFSQLHLFQEKQERMGLVVDEYGELMGLVTIEDILEEIIGEFTTHAPAQSLSIHKQADGSVLVEGSSLLRDLNRKLGMKLPLDGPKTLSGLIIEQFQDIPEAGTSLKIAGHPMEIVQTQDRVVKVVCIYPQQASKPQ
ncbi:MAG TPA: HlyC/CorC family transporter [Burkholderiales bacterium]|nr:HlyC/CorC family transporter [Burkholderiales bacterium]